MQVHPRHNAGLWIAGCPQAPGMYTLRASDWVELYVQHLPFASFALWHPHSGNVGKNWNWAVEDSQGCLCFAYHFGDQVSQVA